MDDMDKCLLLDSSRESFSVFDKLKSCGQKSYGMEFLDYWYIVISNILCEKHPKNGVVFAVSEDMEEWLDGGEDTYSLFVFISIDDDESKFLSKRPGNGKWLILRHDG